MADFRCIGLHRLCFHAIVSSQQFFPVQEPHDRKKPAETFHFFLNLFFCYADFLIHSFLPRYNLLHFVTVPYLHSYALTYRTVTAFHSLYCVFFDLSIPACSILTINATAWRSAPQDFYVCRGLHKRPPSSPPLMVLAERFCVIGRSFL